ncbi:MAG: DivIVA domain-containing protein [Cytophagaceae bacterium]|nr:DivIVA domain-containing protein [Cytophagaceae bacterium]
MKITPLEIRQQSFERVFRGYDKEAVDAFLVSLSQEWEHGQDDIRTLRQRTESLEEEIGKLKAIENTLYRTLQMAEETSHQMMQKSRTDAEERLRSANTEAEETLLNARKQANMLVLDSENRARFIVEEALEELRSLERDYKAIERYKDYLVVEIKRYATDTLEKVGRFEDKAQKEVFEARHGELKSVGLSGTAQPEEIMEPEPEPEAPAPEVVNPPAPEQEPAPVAAADNVEYTEESETTETEEETGSPSRKRKAAAKTPSETAPEATPSSESFFDSI